MNKELTFNDLPMVVAQLRDEVVGMKQMIISLQSQNKPHKANTHIPMSVEEGAPDKPCGVGRADANPKLLLNDT